MFDIPSAVEAASNLINGVVSRVWPDPSEVERNNLERFKADLSMEMAITQAQTSINKQEAAHKSIFVAGWRPFVGWCCAAALLYAAILEPMARFISQVFFDYAGEFPIINTDLTLQILLGMLGLSGMRSFEKTRSVARSK